MLFMVVNFLFLDLPTAISSLTVSFNHSKNKDKQVRKPPAIISNALDLVVGMVTYQALPLFS